MRTERRRLLKVETISRKYWLSDRRARLRLPQIGDEAVGAGRRNQDGDEHHNGGRQAVVAVAASLSWPTL